MVLSLPYRAPVAQRPAWARASAHPAVGLLRRPSLVAAATILLVCVPTGEKDVSAAVHITAADVASGLLVLLLAVDVARGRRIELSRSAAVLFGAVTVAGAVATITSIDPQFSVSGFVRQVQIFVLVPLAVLAALRDRTDLRLVLGSFVLAALIEGAVGAEQYLTRTGASYTGQPIRAVGTFGVLDVMAMSGVVSFGLLAALGLSLIERQSAWLSRVLLASTAFLAFPLAVSFSRGSWIATAVGVTVLLLKADAKLALRWAGVGLAAAVVLFGASGTGASGAGGVGAGGGGIAKRLSSIGTVSGGNEDHSVSDRYDLWATARAIWADHPATGAGPKSFYQLRDSHAPLRLSSGSDTAGAGSGFQREPLLSPHNMYLLVLSDQGLLGFTAYGTLFLVLLLGCLRRRGPAGPVVAGLLCWVLVDFLYADIGGTTTVLTSVILGLAAWSALPADQAGQDRAPALEATA
ncbi:O-antigen ligase family protein [Kitasatospora acidiphila]|uniref:O-antigen ligase family protein n=1 Tax=Kitasatospora acidiphila TaxID=2567942 RepID=A0A540W1Z2_9ACTN|nr:O-antigen ligase family protein [Kitasatospora acidiphila]TQF02987.1 O-antigen ligase family protein [Kitasatospora acidiphila]